MSKKRNLIILSIYLFVLVLGGVIYTFYSSSAVSDNISNLRVDSIEPAVIIK